MANQGIYTDTRIIYGIQFNSPTGTPISMPGNYSCSVYQPGSPTAVFIFNETDGTLDASLKAVGKLTLTALPSQHQPELSAGLYRLHLKRIDSPDNYWAAEGEMLVGNPGDQETYIRFESASDGSTAQSYVVAIAGPAGPVDTATATALQTHQNALDPHFAYGLSFVNRAEVSATNLSSLVAGNTIYVRGHTTEGAGGATYIKLAATPSPVKAWHLPSSDGGYFALHESAVTPEMLGAVGDGVADDTVSLNNTREYANGKEIVLQKTYVTTGWSITAFSGKITGKGTVKAKPLTAGFYLILIGANPINWDGPNLDLSESPTALQADAKIDSGFLLLNARNTKIENSHISGLRYSNPIYIEGDSSLTPSLSDGTKDVIFRGVTAIAVPANTVDIGSNVTVRSNFYTTVDAAVFPASNAVKISDFKKDAAKAFPPTTQNIIFDSCIFDGMERVGLFNVKGVNFTNCIIKNSYTRGVLLSPTCENVTFNGGEISGNSTRIAINYDCKNVSFSNVVFSGGTVSVGQRHSFVVGHGSENVVFSNITGHGLDASHVLLEGVKNVKFSNVVLGKNPTTGFTTQALNIQAGPTGNTATYASEGIAFIGCRFESNYGLLFNTVAGTATLPVRSVLVSNCVFDKTLELFSGAQPTNGPFVWTDNVVDVAGTQTLSSRAFAVFEGGNLSLKMYDTFAASGATSFPSFTNLYYPSSTKEGGGGDDIRTVGVAAFVLKSGETFYRPLIYGIDWIIDGSMAALEMNNTIRMVTATNLAAGDTVCLVRRR